MTYPRVLAQKVKDNIKKYRAIILTGPRQSGKTTLAKMCAPTFDYLSLENPDHRARALDDPRLFLKACRHSTILDEIQNVPEMFSYLQEILDDKSDVRRFILTGSNSFKLNEKISQSLAGRIRLMNVFPLTLEELPDALAAQDLDALLLKGFYPRIYDQDLDPFEWFSDYYLTYVQKDIRSILNVSDVNQFDRFVRLCAGRASQLCEYSSIASEVGVSQPTAIRWASVLESSFITFRLAPHFQNYSKKIIKTPKLYFYDSGFLCQLLRIRSMDALMTHPLRGAIFENFVVAEVLKTFHSYGEEAPIFFWRDQHGHEVDLLIDLGKDFSCLEIKSGLSFQKSWIGNLQWFAKLSTASSLHLVYGGDDRFVSETTQVFSWRDLPFFTKRFIPKGSPQNKLCIFCAEDFVADRGGRTKRLPEAQTRGRPTKSCHKRPSKKE